jgi:bifunctional enzyme CysN/CysC
MTSTASAASDVGRYLDAHDRKTLLRFITCGSVDDGKSTLIGRMLYESRMIFDDQLVALAADSKVSGTQGEELDLALLVDGLAAEREQGITIDVAYRFFSTDRRKFIVADTPGHEQYTRNMVTGGSTASVAVILIDARKGVLTQTKRHSFLVSLLGITKIVLAVNKLDLVDYDRDTYHRIDAEYRAFATQVGLTDIMTIPLSALVGDNISTLSANTPWYDGPTILGYLETVDVDETGSTGAFRFPVQWVNRPDLDFRGYSGTIVGGAVGVGDAIRVLPLGTDAVVNRIVTMDGDLETAEAGQSVTLTLDRELDVSRGDLLCAPRDPAGVADQFECHIVWMNEHALLPGRPYLIKMGTRTAVGSVTAIKYAINVNTLEHMAAPTLHMNEIGVCNISVDRPMPFDAYLTSRDTGGFIVIDRMTNVTVAAGLVHFALRRADNVHWQALEVDRAAHALLKGHRPCVVWFTGLSGAGKSTTANAVERRLHSLGCHTTLLDGDNVRHGLNRDLGFTEAERVENIRRAAEVAKLMVDAGLIVLVSFISPFREERQLARDLVGVDEFCEVFVDTPLGVAEQRDPKGLYRKAREGLLTNFTGIDSPYEPPEDPEVHLRTTDQTPEESAQQVLEQLHRMGVIGR